MKFTPNLEFWMNYISKRYYGPVAQVDKLSDKYMQSGFQRYILN